MFLVFGCKIFLVGGDYWGEVHSIIDLIIVFDIGLIGQYLLWVGCFLSSGFRVFLYWGAIWSITDCPNIPLSKVTCLSLAIREGWDS